LEIEDVDMYGNEINDSSSTTFRVGLNLGGGIEYGLADAQLNTANPNKIRKRIVITGIA
jgi:hypothetical protein